MKQQNFQSWGKGLLSRLTQRKTGVVVGVAAGLTLTFLISCTAMRSFMVTAPEVAGAEFVGNESCALCHEKEVKNFQFSVHARLHSADADMAGEEGKDEPGLSGCESCHGPGSLHVDAGGGRNVHIVNPGQSSEACYRCHADKKADFALPHHHPVPEGKMTCNDCHDPHGSDIMKPGTSLMAGGINSMCAKCHKDQTKHRVFEHEALRDGCTVCHNVHGSVNKKLLTESNASLCLKCHGEIQSSSSSGYVGARNHSSYLTRGNCWTAGCHMAMHGSNVNAHLRY